MTKRFYCLDNPAICHYDSNRDTAIICLIKSTSSNLIRNKNGGIVLLSKINRQIHPLNIFLEVFYQTLYESNDRRAGYLWNIIKKITLKKF